MTFSTSGDGLVRPLNAPQGQQVLPGVQPGVSGGTVLAQFVIIFGTGSSAGVFVYMGTPGPGNPPVFSLSNATEDPYGNAIAPGIWAGPFGGTQAGLEYNGTEGQLLFPVGGTSPTSVGGIAGIAAGSGGAEVQIFSAVDSDSALERVFIVLADHDSTGSTAAYFIVYQDKNGGQAVHIQGGFGGLALNSVNTLTAVLPGTGTSNTNGAQPETWHQATPLSNSWAASGGVAGLFYRLLPFGVVEVIGDIVNTTATGNSVCFTLPAGYRPAVNQNHPAAWNNPVASNSASVPWISFQTSGAIQITGIESANHEIFFHFFAPLGTL